MAKQVQRRISKSLDEILREERKRLTKLTGEAVSFPQASDSLMEQLFMLKRKIKNKK